MEDIIENNNVSWKPIVSFYETQPIATIKYIYCLLNE